LVQPLVLIADDDDDVLLVFGTILRHYGFAVIEATNGAEAIEQAQKHAPDLVLLDMLMPVVDGWQAQRALKADPATADTPVISISVSDVRRSQLEAAGFCAGITKPVEAATLLRAVQHCLEPEATAAGWIDLSRLANAPLL